MYTETEAKQKWCPLARASDIGNQPVSVNRRGREPDADCMCIASACMAWRWADGLDLIDSMVAERNGSRRGFCGAFGPAKAGAT
jgi:hypothetical protein